MFNTFRRATADDLAAVKAAAERFCTRNDIALWADSDPVFEISCYVETTRYHDPAAASTLARQWAACMCRSLGVSYTRNIGIAYGHVGASV